MAKFKVIVSEPSTGKSQVVELEGTRAAPLIGRKLGETVEGTILGMAGKKLQITGGSDKDGVPMRPDVHGGVRAQIIIAKNVGFKPTEKGERKRKMLRGNTITEEIVQVNMKIAEEPKKEKTEKEKAKKAGKEQKQAETESKSETEAENKEEPAKTE